MNDYQENLQVEQTETKPKRKKKTIQERLDRALELKAKTEKQLADIQKRLDGYNKQVEELQVEARLEVIKRYDMSPEELDAALKNYKEGD
ncbi:hypothetical protein UDS23_02425 [Streptococcus salivarius]|jgi:predicted  nucleic acid-binding Zn-ribbon protein|uniref:hypothetical protein n=1 Tax=Streptococcus salivarius TaxID=1304 RepID=UPI001582DBF6|nr:hypothetical protein [Streptococcus salivarius]MEB3645804.1 hypothetical protein [Streptococcus salivarius]